MKRIIRSHVHTEYNLVADKKFKWLHPILNLIRDTTAWNDLFSEYVNVFTKTLPADDNNSIQFNNNVIVFIYLRGYSTAQKPIIKHAQAKRQRKTNTCTKKTNKERSISIN